VTNTDDRSLMATIAVNAAVGDWARLARTAVGIERIHCGDGASSGDWPGDDLERVVKCSTMNCICRMSPCTFAALGNRRANVSN
jgi:hypothetical protein